MPRRLEALRRSLSQATVPGRGRLLRHEQWNIDPASVVSFAALAFGRNASTPAGEGESA